MSLIQIALALGSILLLVLYATFLRSTLRDRALAILLFVTAVVAILFPDLTTRLANILGVGRGTDLLIYLFGDHPLYRVRELQWAKDRG